MEFLGLLSVAVLVFLFFRGDGAGAAGDDTSLPSSQAGGVTPLASSDLSAAFMNGLDNIGQAIFQFEGSKPGNINVRNNNPGNLRSGAGMTGVSGGYATFSDIGDGWDALNAWITSHAAAHPDWDFYDMFDYYLRGSTGGVPTVDAQGDSDAYAEYVAGYLGADPKQKVSSVLES